MGPRSQHDKAQAFNGCPVRDEAHLYTRAAKPVEMLVGLIQGSGFAQLEPMGLFNEAADPDRRCREYNHIADTDVVGIIDLWVEGQQTVHKLWVEIAVYPTNQPGEGVPGCHPQTPQEQGRGG